VNELDCEVGDMVRAENKILSVDLHKSTRSNPEGAMTGLVIGIDVCLEKRDIKYVTKGYIVSVLVDGGLGIYDFNTNYWKVWKIYK